MPVGWSRTPNKSCGRSRGKADMAARPRSASLRRMSSAEAALSQALFSVPSHALIRTSSFGDSDVIMRLRSNSSRRESMAAPPKMETDDADKDGEGATRERSTSVPVTDGAAWVLWKKDTPSREHLPLLLQQQQPPVMQQLQQSNERGVGGVAREDVRVRGEPLVPSPRPQEGTNKGEAREERATAPLMRDDTVEPPREVEGADMAGGQADLIIARETQEDGRAEEEAEQQELPHPGEVGGGREGVMEERGEPEGAAGEVLPQCQLQIQEAEVYEEDDVDGRVESVFLGVNMPLAPQQQPPQRLDLMFAEPEESGEGDGGERAVLRGFDMLLTPHEQQEQDLDAEVAVQLEMVEEGGGGGKGEPEGVCQRKTALTPQKQPEEVAMRVGVERKECNEHRVAELGKKGLSSALVLFKPRRRITRTPTRRAHQRTPVVRLCLRVLRDSTATVAGLSLRRRPLHMPMGSNTSAFSPYIRRTPLIPTSHGSTAIVTTTTTTTTITNARRTTVIMASSSSPPRSSSAHASTTTSTVLTVTPSTTRARHQRCKTRAAVSTATGAGDLFDQWRPYVLPDLTDPAITNSTTTTAPPSVLNRHVGRCAWMEVDNGQDWGLERLLRETRPGLLHRVRSSLRRVRERTARAGATTASSSSNTRTHESDSTGGGGGGGDEAAEAVVAVGCWGFLLGRRSRSSNRQA